MLPMDVPLAVLADAANVSREGKLNIFGIFNQLWSQAFPAHHPQMQLVMVLEAPGVEAGQQKKIDIVLQDADGNKIMTINGKLLVPQPKVAGKRIRINHILPLPGTPVPKAGDYEFIIMINGETKAQVPYSVANIPHDAKTQ